MLCAVLAQSCSVIDDDLSTCAKEVDLRLDLTLRIDLNVELTTQLDADIYASARSEVEERLGTIFSDHAHDIKAAFFQYESNEIKHRIEDIVDANQSYYPLKLPIDHYNAIAEANLQNNGIVVMENEENVAQASFQVQSNDTILSQRTGLFRASRAVEVTNEDNQVIDIHLHQVNSAVVLLVDTTNFRPLDVDALVTGTASGMMLNDSIFLFERDVVVRADKSSDSAPQRAAGSGDIEDDGTKMLCFTAVTMPSQDVAGSDGAYFHLKIYVKNNDETITENVFSVLEPLKAGEVVIIKAALQSEGVVAPVEASQIGATVTLNWNAGGEHDIEF